MPRFSREWWSGNYDGEEGYGRRNREPDYEDGYSSGERAAEERREEERAERRRQERRAEEREQERQYEEQMREEFWHGQDGPEYSEEEYFTHICGEGNHPFHGYDELGPRCYCGACREFYEEGGGI